MSDNPDVVLAGVGGDGEVVESQVVEAIKQVYDPEIPVNIYDLGLIYSIEINNGAVDVRMTLTSPTCPMADEIPLWVAGVISKIPGVNMVRVFMVWDPVWNLEMMSERARFELDLFHQGF